MAALEAIGGGASLARTRVGTPQYWAPEALRKDEPSNGGDGWTPPGPKSQKEAMEIWET